MMAYWALAIFLAAMGGAVLLTNLQSYSADATVGYFLGLFMLLSAAAIFFRKLLAR